MSLSLFNKFLSFFSLLLYIFTSSFCDLLDEESDQPDEGDDDKDLAYFQMSNGVHFSTSKAATYVLLFITV